MSDKWNKKNAKAKLKAIPYKFICDALLEQDIFAEVGNIIKNEILYWVRVHPESIVGKIPTSKINKLIDETRIYSFQFLDWEKKYELKKHWLAYAKKLCLICSYPIIRKQTGVKKRRIFICANCQILYN
jgi:endonuclease-8